MGSDQAKSSTNSPPQGLNKLKMENGYAGNKKIGGFIGGFRRSTSHSHNNLSKDKGSGSGKLFRNESRSYNPLNSGMGGGGSGGDEGKNPNGDVSEKILIKEEDDQVVDGWPKWLTDNIPIEVLAGLVPKSADSYDKLDKIGQGTYSNVYKARDRDTRKIVALKKVRFETSESESVKFMAREIKYLRKLDHPNIIKLEGLATSRMQFSIYLVFDFMQSDLARVISNPDSRLTEPQIKCYMHQLLSGLQHCHERGILHRDIKGSNLLIDKNGMLKIADFGLANHFNPQKKNNLTSRVVTLWYRAPELLLGSTDYGVGIDLWSAGCLLAEMFYGRPIMPGRTEVEQLHRIFKLCGTPPEEYWKKLKLPTTFRPPHTYKPSIFQTFMDLPESSLGLINILLSLDPLDRGYATSALQHKFFYTSPLACDISGLPIIYNEDDESTKVNDRRRSKMKQKSRTHRERRKKDTDTENPKGDSGSSKEDAEKSAEPDILYKEHTTNTGSTSFIVKPTEEENNIFSLISPVKSPQQKLPSPTIKVHPNASNLPPLHNSKTRNANHNKDENNNYRSNQVQRSASSRENRKLDPRKHSKLYAVED